MLALSSKDLTSLEKALGYTFKNKALLKEAVTHKSYAHERQNRRVLFNERMEFLGDAVLELIGGFERRHDEGVSVVRLAVDVGVFALEVAGFVEQAPQPGVEVLDFLIGELVLDLALAGDNEVLG